MKTVIKVGDIVVTMTPCRARCSTCERLMGYTALVWEVYQDTGGVVLQFKERELGRDTRRYGGFFARNLFVTGLFV